MKILLTAFEPFGGNELNSSLEVASMLPDRIANCEIIKEKLPVDFHSAGDCLRSFIERHTPDVVICLGQSRKYEGISVERVALNLMDTIKPDNDGYIPTNEPIHADGDTAYMTTLPVRNLTDACKRKDIAAQISNSAGTYVCNRVYYEALYTIAKRHLPTQALFIHLPYVPEQNKTPFVDKKQLSLGIVVIIEAISEWLQK